jgi:hypothetical protein
MFHPLRHSLKMITEPCVGTRQFTQVDRTIRYIFPDGKEICSEISSKTTSAANTRPRGQHVEPFDVEALSILLEAIATYMAAAAAEEAEKDVTDLW